MRITIKRLTREPLLHFLLIGVALFLVYDLKRGISSETPNQIVVTKSMQQQLMANFNRTWLRAPTEMELAGLIENYVREEVFYRKAMTMGLDQDDPMVRQRMRMKLEFILEDLSTKAVTDEDLVAFLQKHPEKFRSEAKLSFRQVYLDPKKHNNLTGDAQKLLARLNNGIAADSVGDATLSPYEYNLATHSEIARSLGKRFADEAIKLPPGNWTGPIYSTYGVHLVKVSERIEVRQPNLAEIRKLVKREYLVQLRNEQKDLAYQNMRENYEVSIESVKTAQDVTGEAVKTAQADEAK